MSYMRHTSALCMKRNFLSQDDKEVLFKLSWMVGDDASAVRAAALDALAVPKPHDTQ